MTFVSRHRPTSARVRGADQETAAVAAGEGSDMRRLMILLSVVAVTLVAPAASAAEETVIDGLVGPLGLAVGDDGTIYVTEALGFFGGSGRLIAIDKHGDVEVLVDDGPGTEIAGVDATGNGNVVFTRGGHLDVTGHDTTVYRLNGTHETKLASLWEFDQANNPDGAQSYGLLDGANEACLEQVASAGYPAVYTGAPDSHPYAVAIVPGGYAVADAAANTVFMVSNSGHVSTLATLPAVQQELTGDEGFPACAGETYHGEPVPTDVELGPDGDLYVSLLPGFPESPGAGQVWSIDGKTGALTLIADGLTSPVDIAVADDGTIYVAELFASQISMISGGVVSFYTPLLLPGAIEIGRDGSIYATTDVFGNGAVVRLN